MCAPPTALHPADPRLCNSNRIIKCAEKKKEMVIDFRRGPPQCQRCCCEEGEQHQVPISDIGISEDLT
ncbi:hypothetical protein D4764_11G0005940 [Takifugu flavidus]|uniref:Uncharacterized protein n=1 Tax=Takifugu flavidus TaxID=433684 RepID=A0A5C6PG41_9TELE|nr:hypothetical protein D4764_11G0005940 [Takifugu flavidus]